MALEENTKQKTETKLEQTNLPADLNKYILNKLEENTIGPEKHSLKIDIKKTNCISFLILVFYIGNKFDK